MSNLVTQIQNDMIAAMKSRDELKLSVLRMLKSAIQLAQIEKGKDTPLTDDDVLVLVRRLIKQRIEAAEMYKAGGVADRADSELAEAKILEVYQPAQLSDEDLAKIVAKVIAAAKGQADGNRVKAEVQKYLSSLS